MAKKSEKPVQGGIVAVAAYLAGAGKQRIDLEDIAFKANEIAPGRFTWAKYKDQINIELIYKHLWDLTTPDHGELVKGSKKEGWLLTLAGTAFAEAEIKKLHGVSLAGVRTTEADKKRVRLDRARMMSEAAYKKFASGLADQVTVVEAERFFRLDDYVIGKARERKITQAENAFHDDPKLGPAVANAAQLVRSKK
jgi:hypothetical protein